MVKLKWLNRKTKSWVIDYIEGNYILSTNNQGVAFKFCSPISEAPAIYDRLNALVAEIDESIRIVNLGFSPTGSVILGHFDTIKAIGSLKDETKSND